jgi:hypothetical protein
MVPGDNFSAGGAIVQKYLALAQRLWTWEIFSIETEGMRRFGWDTVLDSEGIKLCDTPLLFTENSC